ncbi:hypothetical protein AB6A40_000334 [Gnathostoma spinigerum]|uniref:MMS19 nucleotide excision repair protein n=1 Tax=Gnathostoma spinigerum TaxID=75299 RepID=A0ABD6E1X2_9BILA
MDIEAVEEVFNKLVGEKSISFVNFMESIGPRIKSDDVDEQEKAVDLVVSVICKLPNDFLTATQVSLLLDFLIDVLGKIVLVGSSAVTGINHLVLNSSNLPDDLEILLFQRVFVDGNIQSWNQKTRYHFFEIMEFLLKNRLNGLRLVSSSDFVASFLRCVTGERDPRCLLIVFRLFCSICASFSLGVHVEDMFDCIACYYPIEFNPPENDKTGISREMLVAGCEECLVAHRSFAPFTFQLIAEKLVDEDCDDHAKLEVCAFLDHVCHIFPPDHLSAQLDDILGGLRAVALNPASKKSKEPIPCQVVNCIHSLINSLSHIAEGSLSGVDYLCSDFLENCEPFVLQAEMGMTETALALLEVLVNALPKNRALLFDKVFSWLVMLVRGDTVISAPNRNDVINECIKYLPRWCASAADLECGDLLRKYQKSFFDVLSEFEGLTGSAGRCAAYALATVYARITRHQCDDNVCNFEGLFRRCFICCHQADIPLRERCLQFIETIVTFRWDMCKNFLESQAFDNENSVSVISVLTRMVNEVTMEVTFPMLLAAISSSLPLTGFSLDDILYMVRMNKNSNALLLRTIEELFPQLTSLSDVESSEHTVNRIAEFFQDVGLELPDSVHDTIAKKFMFEIEKSILVLPFVYLFLMQSKNCELLMESYSIIREKIKTYDPGLFRYATIIAGACVNKAEIVPELASVAFIKNLRMTYPVDAVRFYQATVSRALLLRNDSLGIELAKKLFDEISQNPEQSGVIIAGLDELLNFNLRYSRPEKCLYRTTALWRQRIFCQIIPVFVRFFNKVGNQSVKNGLLTLLVPLLSLAHALPVTLPDEYIQLIPVFCSTFEVSLDDETARLLLDAVVHLLESIPLSEMDVDFISKILPGVQIYLSTGSALRTSLLAIKCCEILAQRCSPDVILRFHSSVVCSLTHCLAARKRVLRAAAAKAKNNWELLLTT